MPEPEELKLPNGNVQAPEVLNVPVLVGWLLLGLLVLTAMWLVYRWLVLRSKGEIVPAIPRGAEQELFFELQSLEEKLATDEVAVEEGTIKLEKGIRKLFHRRFGELAFYETSQELRGEDGGPSVAPKAVPFLKVLEACEKLRFSQVRESKGSEKLNQLKELVLEAKKATQGLRAGDDVKEERV